MKSFKKGSLYFTIAASLLSSYASATTDNYITSIEYMSDSEKYPKTGCDIDVVVHNSID